VIDHQPVELELEQEEDGRWIAEIPSTPGALAYGSTPEEAVAKAKAIVENLPLLGLTFRDRRIFLETLIHAPGPVEVLAKAVERYNNDERGA